MSPAGREIGVGAINTCTVARLIGFQSEIGESAIQGGKDEEVDI